jgi:hypothetical protein
MGQPPDDYSQDLLRVEAPAGHQNVVYNIIDATDPSNWVYYLNDNPSGNSEWERFVLSTKPGANPDHLVDSLPVGYYWWYIEGLDLHNLAALRSDCEFFAPENGNGPPDEPPLDPDPPDEFVPEPSALLLLGGGVSALAGYARLATRKKRGT